MDIPRHTVHHPNDVTIQYMIDVMPEKLHHRLKLPGKYIKSYPTRIIRRDGSEREMDWLILVEVEENRKTEKILINVEFQSTAVTKNKIEIFSDYKDYAKTYYGLPVLTVVVITNGYENSQKEYSKVSSDILRPIYIHMDEKKLIERLNNIKKDIDNISDDEAIDMVLLPMFASKEQAPYVTEEIVKLFSKNKTLTGVFREDIGFALSIMVKKYFDLTDKGKELLSMMEQEVTNNRLRNVIDFEIEYERKAFKKELNDKDNELSKRCEEISAKDDEISKKDDEIKKLKAILNQHDIDY